MSKKTQTAILIITITTGIFLTYPKPGNCGVFFKTAAKSLARKTAAKKSAIRGFKKAPVMKSRVPLRTPRSNKPLVNRIVNDANKVAAKGGKITPKQRDTLAQNLPAVKRRGPMATQAMRHNFNSTAAKNTSSKEKMIRQWEQKTHRTWPTDKKGSKAVLHHIIPLESGGANKWWNGLPTFGKGPNHSLSGKRGPHAKGGVLRNSIQRPRSEMVVPGSGWGKVRYRETVLGK